MIEIKNLSVSFGGALPVVDRLNLKLKPGKTTVIVGESGSGKSVTIAAILRLLPNEASVSGSIKLDGRELLELSDKEMSTLRGKEIGYVPQGGGNSMHPLLTVGAQVAEPIAVHEKLPKHKAFQTAIEWLGKMGLTPAEKVAASYPHTLSGGMKQRALIAMGAAGGAQALLADEPTKGLDSKRIAQVEELFRDLKGRTILCVTHDLRFARNISDDICVMYGGKPVEFTDAASFFADPQHPYSRMMLASLPENGMACPDDFTPPAEQRTGCVFYHRCPHRADECLGEVRMLHSGAHHVRCVLVKTAPEAKGGS